MKSEMQKYTETAMVGQAGPLLFDKLSKALRPWDPSMEKKELTNSGMSCAKQMSLEHQKIGAYVNKIMIFI